MKLRILLATGALALSLGTAHATSANKTDYTLWYVESIPQPDGSFVASHNAGTFTSYRLCDLAADDPANVPTPINQGDRITAFCLKGKVVVPGTPPPQSFGVPPFNPGN
jgi:hypothetical protein